MSFLCQLGISGALTLTYNINAGGTNPPENVCMGAAMTAAADRNVGDKVAFQLTNDGASVPAGSGSVTRAADQNGLFTFQIATDSGSTLTKPIHPTIIPRFKEQLQREATLVTAPTAAPAR
jgi:hypothetical protein